VEAVREEEAKLRGVKLVKEVGFKPEEREAVIDGQSGESEEEEVMGEGIGESEMEDSTKNTRHITILKS